MKYSVVLHIKDKFTYQIDADSIDDAENTAVDIFRDGYGTELSINDIEVIEED